MWVSEAVLRIDSKLIVMTAGSIPSKGLSPPHLKIRADHTAGVPRQCQCGVRAWDGECGGCYCGNTAAD